MKLKCNRASMLAAFQTVASVVPVKSTVPILQNVKLHAHGKEVFLLGTDMDVGVVREVSGCEVKAEGVLVLPPGPFAGLLREATDEDVTIESDGNLANLSFKGGKFKIVGADPKEYPTFPTFEAKSSVAMETKDLRDMIAKTAFATSTDTTRNALTGILLVLKGKEIRMVSSDARRLALVRRKTEKGDQGNLEVLIPPKALTILEKSLGSEDETIHVGVQQNQFLMRTHNTMVFTRIVEGKFPDYDAVIPKDYEHKVYLGTEEFLAAVRQSALMTSDRCKAVKLLFKENHLTLLSRAQDVGEGKVDMAVKYTGGDVEIVFNPDFFTDVLRVVGEEGITMEFKDKTSAVVMRGGKDYTYLVMPLTIDV